MPSVLLMQIPFQVSKVDGTNVVPNEPKIRQSAGVNVPIQIENVYIEFHTPFKTCFYVFTHKILMGFPKLPI